MIGPLPHGSPAPDAVAPDGPLRSAGFDRTLPPGSAGKVGELRLVLGPRAGRTRLLESRCRVPFHVGRALHPQADWPELAHLLVTMPTGGFVQGDSVTMSAVALAGARVHLTSQSATRAYRCESATIRQQLVLEARGDSLLEWWPDPLIPYADTSIEQELRLIVDDGATVLAADCWLAGRIARGEVHQYARLGLLTLATRPHGTLLFRDAVRLEPVRQPQAVMGLLGRAVAVGSFFLVGPRVADLLSAPLTALLGRLLLGQAAASRLPDDVGLVVRVLAETPDDLRLVQREVLALARMVLFGRSAGHTYKP